MMDDQRQQRGEPASIRQAIEAARAASRAWIAGTFDTTRRLATDPELLRLIERHGF